MHASDLVSVSVQVFSFGFLLSFDLKACSSRSISHATIAAVVRCCFACTMKDRDIYTHNLASCYFVLHHKPWAIEVSNNKPLVYPSCSS